MLVHLASKRTFDRVMAGGPWSFDHWLLLVDKWSPGKLPNEIQITKFNLWATLFNLPYNYAKDKALFSIGAFLGRVIKVIGIPDGAKVEAATLKYAKVFVERQVTRPLPHGYFVNRREGGPFWMDIRYERLPNLCFKCGLFTHPTSSCLCLDFARTDDGKRKYGPWLKDDGSGIVYYEDTYDAPVGQGPAYEAPTELQETAAHVLFGNDPLSDANPHAGSLDDVVREAQGKRTCQQQVMEPLPSYEPLAMGVQRAQDSFPTDLQQCMDAFPTQVEGLTKNHSEPVILQPPGPLPLGFYPPSSEESRTLVCSYERMRALVPQEMIYGGPSVSINQECSDFDYYGACSFPTFEYAVDTSFDSCNVLAAFGYDQGDVEAVDRCGDGEVSQLVTAFSRPENDNLQIQGASSLGRDGFSDFAEAKARKGKGLLIQDRHDPQCKVSRPGAECEMLAQESGPYEDDWDPFEIVPCDIGVVNPCLPFADRTAQPLRVVNPKIQKGSPKFGKSFSGTQHQYAGFSQFYISEILPLIDAHRRAKATSCGSYGGIHIREISESAEAPEEPRRTP
ncbi:hypothetical protein QQ045_032619 [Rhodiola kirilowii]